MSKIDKKYHKLLNDILENGFKYEDPNRKDIYRYQIPHYTIKHDFKDGFPAITTKKLYWKSIVGELLWFLRGDENIKYLVDNSVNIWNKDAYNYYLKLVGNKHKVYSYEEWLDLIKNRDITNLGFEGIGSEYAKGPVGRIYGAQWRKWNMSSNDFGQKKLTKNGYDYIDQIANLIKGLKENPMGTRHIVTAWNPAELDDMALPPCHWSFEILVEPIKLGTRMNLSDKKQLEKHIIKNIENSKSAKQVREEFLDKNNIPKYQFTLKWHQRSVDSFLGLPFNIASYSLLAHIIGKLTNMIPKGIIGDLSNVHIYEPHLDAVKKQLSRDVNKYGKCELDEFNGFKMDMRGDINQWLNSKEINDFKLIDYNSYPTIPAEMLSYNKKM